MFVYTIHYDANLVKKRNIHIFFYTFANETENMLSKSQIKLIKSLGYKKFRDREGLFVAEGRKVVGELMTAFECVGIYGLQPTDNGLQAHGQWHSVSADDLRRISFLKTPQDVLGVFRIPADEGAAVLSADSLSLALDDVQDPGNMGTIIRLADWFGIRTVYCSVGCADCWSPKVVQATMGSIARVKVVCTDLVRLVDEAESLRCPVFGTFLDGENVYERSLPENGLVVMGNEGNGISDVLRSRITERLLIPSFNGGAESLNVALATAIILSEFKRGSKI